MFNSGASLADIAAVTGRNNDGFGDGNGWWVLVILFALFGGWGRNGYGNNGGEGSCNSGVGAEVQRGFDTSAIISKLDGINNGICSLGYDQLAQMNGINQNVMQTGFDIQQAINQDTVAGMQNTFQLGSKIDSCCCENRQGQADIKYTMAQDTCAITTAIKDAVTAIIQNDNSNYRLLHDENVAAQIKALEQRLAEKESLIQTLNLAQSQANQNSYLVAQLRPTPQPAYTVPNPYTGCCGNVYGNCGGCNQF